MSIMHSSSRQHGASAWTMIGSLLVVAGLAGLGVALFKPGSPTPSIARVAPESSAAAPLTADTKPAALGTAPTEAAKTGPASSGLHPNWHGIWQGTSPHSKMVITAAGVEIFDVYENDGKQTKFHSKLPWGNTSEASGNGEESGYAKLSMSIAEISRAYAATVAAFERDPSDLSISDPILSRRMIGRIKPGNYRVVWADSGGDCGLRDMIIDGDLILSIVQCKYRHEISIFTRQGAAPLAVEQGPQGTARVKALPPLPSGSWQGSVTQSGYSPYLAVMQLQPTSTGIPGGTMAYPSMACTASLTFMRSEGNAFLFRESIQEGRGRCMDGGQIWVSAISEDAVSWRYFVAENIKIPVATGTFRR